MTNGLQNHDPERLERSLRVWLTEGRPPVPDREARIHDVLDELDDTPRTRARFLGRWLDRDGGARRGADAHDHRPNTNRRTRFMFTATALTAALAVLALTVSVQNTDTVPPYAAGATHVVAADGSGDFVTIQDAVDAAETSDTISIAPGAYAEAVLIEKDVTLVGDGARGDVVVSPGDTEDPAITLRDTNATLRSLTLSGDGTLVLIDGGAPQVEDVAFHAAEVTDVGHPLTTASLLIENGSEARIMSNEFTGAGFVRVDGLAQPLIEGNQLSGGPYIWLDSAGPDTVIRGNAVLDTVYSAIGLGLVGELLIEDNDLTGAHLSGIAGYGTGGNLSPTIRGNRIADNDYGISLPPGAGGVVEGNKLQDNRVAVSVRSDVMVRGNEIIGDGTGVMVLAGGAPEIDSNSIDVRGRGIVATDGSSPSIKGNDVCGGDLAIWVAAKATPVLGANTTC